MTNEIEVALIAGIVSLVVSIIGTLSSWVVNHLQLQSRYTDRLLALRLEHYPRAFALTEQIQRRPEPQGIIQTAELQRIGKELYDWKTGVVSLIISGQSLACFYALRDNLKMEYSEKERFSSEQVEKIMTARGNFRRSLRTDLGFLYKEDFKHNL